MVYQFKIQIKGITKPPVWRTINVPANFTFLELHQVIQLAFGWGDYHLFEFRDKEYQSNIIISIPDEEESPGFDFFAEELNASKTKLSAIFSKGIHKMLYIYDFGDNWVHTITLEASSSEKAKNAVCLSGKGACPPEDCGGIYGYEEIKNVFQSQPESEEANEYRSWLFMEKDETWDPKAIDIDGINEELKHM